jgi:hypothetical protein
MDGQREERAIFAFRRRREILAHDADQIELELQPDIEYLLLLISHV